MCFGEQHVIVGVRKTRRGTGSSTKTARTSSGHLLCSATVCFGKEQQNKNLNYNIG